jgi:hypothetical protein
MIRFGVLLALTATIACNSNQGASGTNTTSVGSAKPADKPATTATAPGATTAGASTAKRLAYPGTADGLKALLTTEFTKTEADQWWQRCGRIQPITRLCSRVTPRTRFSKPRRTRSRALLRPSASRATR